MDYLGLVSLDKHGITDKMVFKDLSTVRVHGLTIIDMTIDYQRSNYCLNSFNDTILLF